MKHTPMRLAAAGAVALTVAAGAAPSAQAAQGGTEVKANPGVVALYDAQHHHVCNGVQVAPQWVLTASYGLECGSATVARVGGLKPASGTAVGIDRQERPANTDPGEGQSRLLHLSKPVDGAPVFELADNPPATGEELRAVSFRTPEGDETGPDGNPLVDAPVTVKGVSGSKTADWLSWYGSPKGMTITSERDKGSALVKDGKLVAFVLGWGHESFTAENTYHLRDWIASVK